MEAKIKIINLGKKFDEFTAVDGLNFDVYANEIFGLLGPNGAGKTTTINMICGLLPPSEGNILFNNKKRNDIKSNIGYCSQENIIYPKLTCMEQLLFVGSLYDLSHKDIKQRAKELLQMLGLEDKAEVRATKLSGGMKRRLNICLSIIHDPEIIILDEPEAGLDPQSRILVREVIKSFRKEKTIILTTHNMDEADRLVDRLAIIDYGKLLVLDTPKKLKQTLGEGDILELKVETNDNKSLEHFINKINAKGIVVQQIDNTVLMKHSGIVELIPFVKSSALDNNLEIEELRLRECSLEDVFIHLTGRRLRQ